MSDDSDAHTSSFCVSVFFLNWLFSWHSHSTVNLFLLIHNRGKVLEPLFRAKFINQESLIRKGSERMIFQRVLINVLKSFFVISLAFWLFFPTMRFVEEEWISFQSENANTLLCLIKTVKFHLYSFGFYARCTYSTLL